MLDSPNPQQATKLCGRNAVQVRAITVGNPMTLDQTAQRLRHAGEVQASAYMIRCNLAEGGVSLTAFADGRVIVQGTADESRARSLVARYLGS